MCRQAGIQPNMAGDFTKATFTKQVNHQLAKLLLKIQWDLLGINLLCSSSIQKSPGDATGTANCR